MTTNSDGASRAVIEYKPANESDNSYTTNKPTASGVYQVRVSIPETDTFLASICTTVFTISLNRASSSVTVGDQFAGTTYSPVITTDSDGLASAVIEYKEKNAPDNTYSTTRPNTYGSYMVRVTIPETANYTRTVCTADYKIVYLPSPDNAYALDGTVGNNDYFTSDVELKAPDGYTISTSFNGNYTSSVAYSENLRAVYLKRTSDGALTSAIAVNNRPQIDKDAPSFEDSTGNVSEGAFVFADSVLFTTNDDNLVLLKVNGEPIDLETLGSVLTLSPGNGIMKYTIIAEDIAGNISKIEFTLMAEWLRERIIPADLVLPLTINESYNLDGGRWTVSGDDTVYNGGIPIYVTESGDYTFSRVG